MNIKKESDMRIIGVSGKAESGKTTFSMMLKEELERKGYKVLFINYGDFLKFVCSKYYNWNEEKDEIGRRLLQYVGTDRGRVEDENIWVNMVISTLKVCQWDYDVAIIGDCRFVNEFEEIEKTHWRFDKVRINRTNAYFSELTPEQRKHPSETSLDNYEKEVTFIENDGDLEALRLKARIFIELKDF